MKYCEWCKHLTDKLTNYKSAGTGLAYQICDKCLTAAEEETCRKCGQIILGKDIAGLCTDCAQDESTEEQRKINEIAEGVNVDLLQEYTSELVFTESDYERWVVLSQKTYTREEIKRNRLAWLKNKLAKSKDWTNERIERNVDALAELIDKYSSNILKSSYMLIYYPEKPEPGFNGKRPTASILDRIGDVILIEVE